MLVVNIKFQIYAINLKFINLIPQKLEYSTFYGIEGNYSAKSGKNVFEEPAKSGKNAFEKSAISGKNIDNLIGLC